jgi:hypothetical protein
MVGVVLVTWWMIESPSFFVTCLTQWGIILIIFYILNGFMNKRFTNDLNN